jgi:predicted DNA-binding protein YlxM (UPF0122 family)
MEKKVQLSMLFGIYGSLLTKRQYNILNDYCNDDLSLSEIAENNNITRQAVNDIGKKGENKLLEYESKLGIMKKTLNQEKQIQMILSEISKITDNSSDKKIEKILNNVQKELTVMI